MMSLATTPRDTSTSLTVQLLQATKPMMKITCLPDRKEIDVRDGETILEATLRANLAHAHACGGQARCSTCRVWILEGLENCVARSDRERSLADRLRFGPEVRLACQTK